MPNPERISIKTNTRGEPFEMAMDPRSVNQACLKAIVKKLMDQTIQFGYNVQISINLPGFDQPLQYNQEDFLKASKEEKEEELLNNASDLMLGADKIVIRKHRFSYRKHTHDNDTTIFKNFIENEMQEEF